MNIAILGAIFGQTKKNSPSPAPRPRGFPLPLWRGVNGLANYYGL